MLITKIVYASPKRKTQFKKESEEDCSRAATCLISDKYLTSV